METKPQGIYIEGAVIGEPLDPKATLNGGLSLNEEVTAYYPWHSPFPEALSTSIGALEPFPSFRSLLQQEHIHKLCYLHWPLVKELQTLKISKFQVRSFICKDPKEHLAVCMATPSPHLGIWHESTLSTAWELRSLHSSSFAPLPILEPADFPTMDD